MAQNQRRMIYTKLWTSEQFSRLPDRGKLLYIGMITLADDDGRLMANPAYLRGQIFTYDDITVLDVLNLRDIIEKVGLIDVYKLNDSEYIQHPNWESYQIIRSDMYIPSRFPDRNGLVAKPIQNRYKNVIQDKISKDKIIQIPFDEFWKLYPNKVEKKKAEIKWNKLTLEVQKKIIDDLPQRVVGEKWKKENGRFIEMPTTYLNGERWNDEIKKTNTKQTFASLSNEIRL